MKIFRWQQKSKKYLVSLSNEETTKLYEITKLDLYKRLSACLISHWAMNLIALGVYVSKLNESDQRDIVERVKSEVHSKYQALGLRILYMGSTGVIQHIIEYLSDLKINKNYNSTQMGAMFDKIIEKWDEITTFVKATDSLIEVKKFCL